MNLPASKQSKGFSLIELLLVIFFIGILFSFSIPSFSAFNRRQDIKLSTKTLKTDLREVQSRSVHGRKDNAGEAGVWGVRFLENSAEYEIFHCPLGDPSTYASVICRIDGSEFRSLQGVVEILSITDNPPAGGFNVIFDFGSGEVLFLNDEASTITDASGTPIDEADFTLNVPNGDSVEDRIVRVFENGNIEDIKP